MNETKRTNRNGRKGILTSWDSKAREDFIKLYSLYSQFRKSIYLEDNDIKKFMGYYKGKAKHKIDRLKLFILNEFKLMGYPQKKNNQYNGYIETYGDMIVLNFALNEESIDKALFSEYIGENRLTEKNEALESPINEDKAEGNIKPLVENSRIARIKEKLKLIKVDSIYIQKEDEKRKENLKGGWIEDGEDFTSE